MSNCIGLKGVEFCDKNKTCNDALMQFTAWYFRNIETIIVNINIVQTINFRFSRYVLILIIN